MAEGLHRKFANPLEQSAASSPLVPSGDPVVRKREVTNRNVARNSRFVFNCEKLNHVNFFVKSMNAPGISVGEATFANPFTDVPVPGDKMNFNPLIVRIAVDEDFENWLEIQRWMRALSFPEAHNENDAIFKAWLQKETCSASMSIMSNGGNFEIVRFYFQHLWPADLEDFDLDAEGNDDEITTTISFRYSTYRVERFPEGEPPA